MSDKVMIISSDCHAGALPGGYDAYMPKKYHAAARDWWLKFAREMMARSGTFFDQEAVEDYNEKGGERGLFGQRENAKKEVGDDELLRLLSDESSPFAPRRGEFDAVVRAQDLDADGVAGEIVFPQMAPFGAGLLQYRDPVSPEQNLEGIRAYNRWLGDFCKTNPGRHAGIAIINVDDIDATVQEVREAKKLGLWGGVLLPTSTGAHPFYHHPRYEPLWEVCEELEMPLHSFRSSAVAIRPCNCWRSFSSSDSQATSRTYPAKNRLAGPPLLRSCCKWFCSSRRPSSSFN
jgi:hypothetical protein